VIDRSESEEGDERLGVGYAELTSGSMLQASLQSGNNGY
jgi:hypothetical protein